MKKIRVFPVMVMLFLTLFMGIAPPAFGGVPLCRVGLSPWQQGRPINHAIETEYRFNGYQEVVTLGKGGRVSGRCVLDPEESTVVVPNRFNPEIDSSGLAPEDLPWLRVCGNPIVSKFSLATMTMVAPPVEQRPEVNLNYSPPPAQSQEQNLFVFAAPAPVSVEKVEKGTCWWCWFLVALVAIGVGAYAYSVSQKSQTSSPPPSSGGPVNPPLDGSGGPVDPPLSGGGGPVDTPLSAARFR